MQRYSNISDVCTYGANYTAIVKYKFNYGLYLFTEISQI